MKPPPGLGPPFIVFSVSVGVMCRWGSWAATDGAGRVTRGG